MTDKVVLAECESSSILNSGKQRYIINYLSKVFKDGKIVYSDKIEFALITPSDKGSGESVYRSYRMVDPSQVELLIMDLVKAKAFFEREKGLLNSTTIISLPYLLSKKILNKYKEVYSQTP